MKNFHASRHLSLLLVLAAHVLLASLWRLQSHTDVAHNVRYLVMHLLPAEPHKTPAQPPIAKEQTSHNTISPKPIHTPIAPPVPATPVPTPDAPAATVLREPEALSMSPAFDLDHLRKQAFENDKNRERTPVELAQATHLRDHSLETALGDKAKKAVAKDCRTAYAGVLLLAPLAAAFDVARGKPCKW